MKLHGDGWYKHKSMRDDVRAPELITIIVNPDPSVCNVWLGGDGQIEFDSITLIGFSNFPEAHRISSDRPSTKTWVSTSPVASDFHFWELVHAHGTSYKKVNDHCICGDKNCRRLGVVDTKDTVQLGHLEEAARKRREWLAKRDAQREKQREYMRRRKAAA